MRLLTEALPILAMPMLAEAPLPDPTSHAAIGWLLAGAFALVGMANQGMELWKKLHPEKTPPDSVVYATKTELAAIEKRVEEAVERLEGADKTRADLIERWRQVQDDWMRQVERAIGRIEAKVDRD